MDISAGLGALFIREFHEVGRVSIYFKRPPAGTDATSYWRLGAWSDKLGYPSLVTRHQERLIFAGSPMDPERIYFSSLVGSSKRKFSFTSELGLVTHTASLSLSILYDTHKSVKWLHSFRDRLLVGTDKGEWEIEAGEDGAAISH